MDSDRLNSIAIRDAVSKRANLDRESADRVMELLTEINRDDKTTFLISTHDERIAERCRRQIRMLDGLVVG